MLWLSEWILKVCVNDRPLEIGIISADIGLHDTLFLDPQLRLNVMMHSFHLLR